MEKRTGSLGERKQEHIISQKNIVVYSYNSYIGIYLAFPFKNIIAAANSAVIPVNKAISLFTRNSHVNRNGPSGGFFRSESRRQPFPLS